MRRRGGGRGRRAGRVRSPGVWAPLMGGLGLVPTGASLFPRLRQGALSLLGTVGLSLQRPCPGPPASHTHLASSLLFFSIFIIWLSWVLVVA